MNILARRTFSSPQLFGLERSGRPPPNPSLHIKAHTYFVLLKITMKNKEKNFKSIYLNLSNCQFYILACISGEMPCLQKEIRDSSACVLVGI